jgi:hypothetical protein
MLTTNDPNSFHRMDEHELAVLAGTHSISPFRKKHKAHTNRGSSGSTAVYDRRNVSGECTQAVNAVPPPCDEVEYFHTCFAGSFHSPRRKPLTERLCGGAFTAYRAAMQARRQSSPGAFVPQFGGQGASGADLLFEVGFFNTSRPSLRSPGSF